MNITLTPISKLKPYEENPRLNDKAVEKVAASLREFGFRQPIVADPDNVIIAGHTRWKAAKKLGLKQVPVHTVTNLTPEQIRAYRIADNRTAEEAEWDNEALVRELVKLSDANFSLELTGFDEAEIAKLMTPEEPETEPEAKTDKAADLQAKWKTDHGQLWLLGPHRLAIGDSTHPDTISKLMAGDKAALVFTDPPYGVSYNSEATGSIQNDDKTGDALVSLIKPALELAVEHAADDAAFYVWHASSTRRDFEWALDAVGLTELQYLVWIKETFVLGRADYHWQTEPCFYAAKRGKRPKWLAGRDQSTAWRITRLPAGPADIWLDTGAGLSDSANSIYLSPKAPKGCKRNLRVAEGQSIRITVTKASTDAWQVSRDDSKDYLHPTQKPTELAERAIRNHTAPQDIVLDPFGGSGSTLLACQLLGRHARTAELDPKFAAVILDRWHTLTGNEPSLE